MYINSVYLMCMSNGGREAMNCKETCDLISKYIDEQLDPKVLKSFISHIENCPECRDELEVRYLVKEGLHRLESGDSFNLRDELERKLNVSKRVLIISQKAKQVLVVTAVIMSLLLIGVVLGVIIL